MSRQTDRQMDISYYRVASVLKKVKLALKGDDIRICRYLANNQNYKNYKTFRVMNLQSKFR